jgi:antitoxin (DNA-binding transcriptional repressor) of toxin-antitoxin stability system
VKTLDLAEATGALSLYAKRARKQPVVVMYRGKPLAALVPLDQDAWEDFVVSTHPGFIEIIERSRASYREHGGIPLKEIEREFGLQPLKRRRPRQRRAQ